MKWRIKNLIRSEPRSGDLFIENRLKKIQEPRSGGLFIKPIWTCPDDRCLFKYTYPHGLRHQYWITNKCGIL